MATPIVANNTTIEVEDGTGMLDISGDANTVEITPSEGAADYFKFGFSGARFVSQGTYMASLSMTIYVETAITGANNYFEDWYENAKNEERQIDVYLPTKEDGARLYSSDYKLTELAISGGAGEDDPVQINVSLESHGAFSLNDYYSA